MAALLALSGCVVTEDDVKAAADEAAGQLEAADFGSAQNNQTAQDAANALRAITNVSANVTGLNVTLTITVDGDGTLAYDVAYGDNSSANGTLARAVQVNETATPTGNASYTATLVHNYTDAGTYNITVTVSAGNVTMERTLNVTVGAGPAFAPTQDPIHLEGSVVCLPTIVLNGEVAGETQTLPVMPGQRGFTLTLAYGETLVEDLDFVLTSPGGKEYVSEEAGPEPPLEVAEPEAGDWILTVVAYSCMLELSYTVDVVFA